MSFRDSWGWKGAGVGREDHIGPHEDSGFFLEEKEASGGFKMRSEWWFLAALLKLVPGEARVEAGRPGEGCRRGQGEKPREILQPGPDSRGWGEAFCPRSSPLTAAPSELLRM